MALEDKPLTEKESIELITEMISKAKGNFHESGTSAILWGTVIGICGLVSFAQMQWNFNIGFDMWWITFAAVIPQIWIIIQERKRKIVKTHPQHATDVVWLVYAVSVICLIIYSWIVPGVSAKLFNQDGLELLSRNIITGEMQPQKFIIPSFSSIYLIVYAFPTLATGLINRFHVMIYGAIICYGFFVLSLFTPFKYDMLLNGLAGIGNWLIPGLLLRQRYLKGVSC